MKTCMWAEAGEFSSRRFHRFCDHLKLETPGEIANTYGHLHVLFDVLVSDTETDHGILRGLTTTMLGRMAQYPQPRAFGEALRFAGYLAKLEDYYPAELSGPEGGFVVLQRDGSPVLELSWASSYHGQSRRVERIADLFRYIGAERRWGAVRRHGFDLVEMAERGHVPAGWADEYARWCGREGAEAGPYADCTQIVRAQSAHMPSCVVKRSDIVKERDLSPVCVSVVRSGSREGVGTAACAAVASSRYDYEREEKGREEKRREEKDDATTRAGPGGRTGTAKSEELREYIRQHMYGPEALAALYRLDDTQRACVVWEAVHAKMPQMVGTALAELTEPAAWRRIKSPAAFVMSKLYPLFTTTVRDDKSREREEATAAQAACG